MNTKLSIWISYLEALLPHLVPLLGSSLLFGVPEMIARFSQRFRQRLDKVSQSTRWVLEIMTLSIAIFYAGFNAWNDERITLIDTEKSRIATNRQFIGISEIYKDSPRLGNATSDPITATHANIEVHENAVILLVEPLNAIIKLSTIPNTDGIKQFDIYEDQTNKNDPSLFDDDKLRSWFGLPPDCAPPTGGVAVLARANQSEWKGIGCRTWRCDLSSLKYQEFENGYVISGVPKFDTAGINRSFFLENAQATKSKKGDQHLKNKTGTWNDKTSQEEITLCAKPL